MRDPVYTLGLWRVQPGSEDAFIAAWKALGETFARLPAPPAGKGTLVQSLTERGMFYSFGPWPDLEAVQAMREDPDAQAAIERLRQLCTEATSGRSVWWRKPTKPIVNGEDRTWERTFRRPRPRHREWLNHLP